MMLTFPVIFLYNNKKIGGQMKKHKQTIIIFLLILIFLGMAIGYSVLQTKLNITGTSQIIGNFDVFISNVAEAKVEGAKTKSTSVDDPLAASFEVSLEKPGSYAIYNVTVKNNGNLDAELTQIDGLQQESDFTFTVENLSEQDLLLAGAEKIFQVRIGWDPDSTTIPKGQVKLQLKLSYTQVSLGDREVDITPPTANPTIQENGTNYLVVQSGCEDSQSSIRYVEYQVNEQEWAPGEQTEKLENLKSGEYHIKVKCTNSNGLEVISNEISASTKEFSLIN